MKIMKQSLTKRLFLPAIALCALFLSGTAAHAALVTYSFTGGVSTISGALLSPTMNLTSPVTGSFQFDNATAGVGGHYPGAVTRDERDDRGLHVVVCSRSKCDNDFSEYEPGRRVDGRSLEAGNCCHGSSNQ